MVDFEHTSNKLHSLKTRYHTFHCMAYLSKLLDLYNMVFQFE